MDDASRPYLNYADYSLSPGYVLGHAFHALGRLGPAASVHGRFGVIALLDDLFRTLERLGLPVTVVAAEPLHALHRRITPAPRFSRLGGVESAEIAGALSRIEAALQLEMSSRTVEREASIGIETLLKHPRRLLGEAGFARLPAHLRRDFAEGCRALVHHLPTASIFHLSRVWTGLCPEPPPVGDPGRDPALHCTDAEALEMVERIRRMLQEAPDHGPR